MLLYYQRVLVVIVMKNIGCFIKNPGLGGVRFET
jgi:hypothetical protein